MNCNEAHHNTLLPVGLTKRLTGSYEDTGLVVLGAVRPTTITMAAIGRVGLSRTMCCTRVDITRPVSLVMLKTALDRADRRGIGVVVVYFGQAEWLWVA